MLSPSAMELMISVPSSLCNKSMQRVYQYSPPSAMMTGINNTKNKFTTIRSKPFTSVRMKAKR